MHFLYEYTIDGKKYESSFISFNANEVFTEAGCMKILANYPVGSVQTAYYNPSDPAMAVLRPAEIRHGVLALAIVGVLSWLMLSQCFVPV